MNRIPNYSTKLFCEIYDNPADFIADWKDSGLAYEEESSDPIAIISDNNMTKLFLLLYARYGNNPIANMDENQFKYKMWSIIYISGPAWVKRKEVQAALRELSEDEMLTGAKIIHNHAYNPSTTPSTNTTEELNYINQQTTDKYQKSKLDAYATLWELLDTDVTTEFLNKFQKLFKQFVTHERPTIYISEADEGDED